MKILVGSKSDLGRFAEHPPVPGAEIIEWIEPQSGGVTLGGPDRPAVRHPDKSTLCRAWAIEVESLEQFIGTLDHWRTDHAASVEVEVRDRGRGLDAGKDLVVVLLDYDGNEFFRPLVVEERQAERTTR